MSIILKGIDMPKNGESHHITIYDNGNTYITTSNMLCETDRKDVEAIQLPKGHGRLIEEYYPGELLAKYPDGSLFKNTDRFKFEEEAEK